MTYRTSEDLAQETSPFRRFVRGMIRRLAITLTAETKWQLLGQRGGQGGDETPLVEPFTGIGFYSRPPSSGNPEAVAVAVGGSKTTVIVATRDEATRQAVAGDIAEGETCVYNDKALIVVKADGTVEIRLAGGVAIPLATKADLDKLRANFAAWTPVPNDGGAALKAILVAAGGILGLPTWPVGTTVLKAQ